MPTPEVIKQPQLCGKIFGEYPTAKETRRTEAKSRKCPAVTSPAGKNARHVYTFLSYPIQPE